MDKNQKLSRPGPSTVKPGKAAPVGQRPMAQQPGKAETRVTPPQGKAEMHGAPEKKA
jgi:hypothetical protein